MAEIEIPTDPAVCELYDSVCLMRRGNGMCPLHERLIRLESLLETLEESAKAKRECYEADYRPHQLSLDLPHSETCELD